MLWSVRGDRQLRCVRFHTGLMQVHASLRHNSVVFCICLSFTNGLDSMWTWLVEYAAAVSPGLGPHTRRKLAASQQTTSSSAWPNDSGSRNLTSSNPRAFPMKTRIEIRHPQAQGHINSQRPEAAPAWLFNGQRVWLFLFELGTAQGWLNARTHSGVTIVSLCRLISWLGDLAK